MRLYKLIFLLALLIITVIIYINKYTAFYAIVYFVVRRTFSNSIVINNILKARTQALAEWRIIWKLKERAPAIIVNPRSPRIFAGSSSVVP